MLEFKNLTCSPDSQPGIHDLTFTIEKNEITLIKGLSEDGLLTLENVITGMNNSKAEGLLKTDSGIELNIKKLTSRILRHKLGIKIGIIPTNRKFRGSNPSLTLSQITGDSPKSALELIELSKINIKPDELVKNLSGGMLQRFILNRELSLSPDYLILCHPLQGLDPEAADFMCEQLKKAASDGCGILVLSAGEFPEALCNKFYKLYRGRFV